MMFLGSLMKIFKFVPVRNSAHEPTSLHSDLR